MSFAVRRPHRPVSMGLLGSVLALAFLALFAGRAAAQSKVVVDERESPAVGHTVLTNLRGLTLYSLSSETHGRFQCAEADCLALWKPLMVPRGVKPTGPVKLGTVERPNGKRQVTYKGRPLYHFYADMKSGEANGEGFKAVRTWHAATVPTVSSAPPPAQPQPPTSPYPQPTPRPQPSPEPPHPYPY